MPWDVAMAAQTVKPEIVYASQKFMASFHHALTQVANERVYLEMIEPPPLEQVIKYQTDLIAKNGPSFWAIDNDRVVGWCDIFPNSNPRLSHRGGLGMGLLPEYRGQGIGARLLTAAIDHAKVFGLEKVELTVYTNNPAGIALYKKLGFEEEGMIRKYRKLDDKYFDGLLMAKFLR